MSAEPNRRMHQTQAQVNEVVDIMRDNMERVIQRDEKLSDLDHRADSLQIEAQQFEATAIRLRRKYWWQNMKMWLILGVVVAVIIIIIIVAITTSVKEENKPNN